MASGTFAAITDRLTEEKIVCEEFHTSLPLVPVVTAVVGRHAVTKMVWKQGQMDNKFP